MDKVQGSIIFAISQPQHLSSNHTDSEDKLVKAEKIMSAFDCPQAHGDHSKRKKRTQVKRYNPRAFSSWAVAPLYAAKIPDCGQKIKPKLSRNSKILFQ